MMKRPRRKRRQASPSADVELPPVDFRPPSPLQVASVKLDHLEETSGGQAALSLRSNVHDRAKAPPQKRRGGARRALDLSSAGLQTAAR